MMLQTKLYKMQILHVFSPISRKVGGYVRKYDKTKYLRIYFK